MELFGTLQSAYGRDYKSRKALLEDWNNGKDFRCALSGQYCSSRDVKRNVNVRYNVDTCVAVLKYDKAKEVWK